MLLQKRRAFCLNEIRDGGGGGGTGGGSGDRDGRTRTCLGDDDDLLGGGWLVGWVESSELRERRKEHREGWELGGYYGR